MQQDARTLLELGVLKRFITPFGLPERGTLMRASRALDYLTGLHLSEELGRRAISQMISDRLGIYPWWEIPRTIYSRSNINPKGADDFYFFCLKQLSRYAARRVGRFTAVYAFDTAAVDVFRAAKKLGLTCIYGVSSFDPRAYANIVQMEHRKFPALFGLDNKIADTNNEQIQRREEAWKLADVVLLNSQICRNSHAAFGLDLEKAHVLPLAFPEPIRLEAISESVSGPLKLLWAGTFSVMKGAHYFLEAQNMISDEFETNVRIFGINKLPLTFFSEVNKRALLKPTVPRNQLCVEYCNADVLVMPTLSDGFGMVILEAMSQGLPVITTPRAGAASIIQNGVNGIVVPESDPVALAQALRWCNQNRVKLRQMGREARQTAVTWQWVDYRKKLTNLLLGTSKSDTQ